MTRPLPDPVRTMLRYQRHDLAGRIHVLLAAIELAGADETYLGGGAGEALALLRDLERAWRVELARCDLLLSGQPMPFPTDAHRLSEVLGLVTGEGTFLCDPDALVRVLRHGHKAIGRASLYAHTTRVENLTEGLRVELRAGSCAAEPTMQVYEAFPGDGDAYLCHAESRLAGVTVTAARDDDGVVLLLAIPSVQARS